MSEPLTAAQVQHVAKLARLRLTPDQIEVFRAQLSTILEHVDRIGQIDTTGVESMAYPLAISNRLAADVPGKTMPLADLLRNAPAVEGDFLAVPKVLGEDGGSA